MSGIAAQRGFIVQSIIAMIECLMDNNWDEIKLEPKTVKDKVDFKMYQDNKTLKAIQVKSSKNQFERSDVIKWFEEIQNDCNDETQNIILYLVGDVYSKSCEDYIKNNSCIKKISLSSLDAEFRSKLLDYFRKKDMYNDIKVADFVLLEDALFSIVHRNSTDPKRLKRETIENRFQNIIKSFPYKKNYLENLKYFSVSSDIPYVRDDNLFNIISKFLQYQWTDKVSNLLASRKLPEETKERLKEIISLEEPFENRRIEYKQYLRETIEKQTDEKIKKTNQKLIEDIKSISFGNCLFICGRYGVGKTRFLYELMLQEKKNNEFFCYCDLIDNNGQFDETVVDSLIQKYFWVSEGATKPFLLRFDREANQDKRIILMFDNLDYAFQRGLSLTKLKRTVASYSVCNTIKWIFTIQSGQRFLVWSENTMGEFAHNYGFSNTNKLNQSCSENDIFRGYDLDMDELSAKAKIFESILQNEIGTFEHNDASNWSNVEIRLRQNHQYDAYLIPYIAELLIRLEWEWTTIANVEHLSYRSLCKEHKKQLLENMSVFSTNDPYALKNLCINLVLMLIDTGRSTWLETDNWKDKNIWYDGQSLLPLQQVGVLGEHSTENSSGYNVKEYVTTDNLFWAEQTAEIMVNRSKGLPFEEKLDKCAANEKPVSKLPYFTDIQRLFLLLILEEHVNNKERNSDDTLLDFIIALTSANLYPLAADSLSFAGEEQVQKTFFSASIKYFRNQVNLENGAKNYYMLISSFYEYCSTIQLSDNNWRELISVIPTTLSGELMKRTLEDLSTLLKRRQSDLNTDILSDILAQLGNVNSDDSDSLAERISQLYFTICKNESELIGILLNNKKLQGIRKVYKRKPYQSYPYCLAESTISMICDRIVSNKGILKTHELLRNKGWYAQDRMKNISFFMEIRRKSLNLSLAYYARTNNYMHDLEEQIRWCLTRPKKDLVARSVYQEEAFYLCCNSVLADERDPMAFTENIYKALESFVKNQSMEYFFKKEGVRRCYARHNLFALFYDCDILLTKKGKRESFECHVIGYCRDSIMIKNGDGKEKKVKWYNIDRIEEKNHIRKRKSKKRQF